jgi:hypothetical protein
LHDGLRTSTGSLLSNPAAAHMDPVSKCASVADREALAGPDLPEDRGQYRKVAAITRGGALTQILETKRRRRLLRSLRRNSRHSRSELRFLK